MSHELHMPGAGAPVWSPDRYLVAYRFAASAHRDQLLPGSDLPYVIHVTEVAMEVLGALAVERFETPDLAVQCALLHDTIEDTQTSYEALVHGFGQAVADGALALTKDESLPKHERMADSLRRIRQQPREVWIVKLADRITNLQAPPAYWSPDKRRGYRDEAQEILAELGPASQYLSQRMRAKISAYAAFF